MAFNYWLHVEITLSKTKLHPSVLDRTKILNLAELGLSTETLTCWHQSAPSLSVETRIHWGFIAGAVILLAALAYFVLVKLRHNNLNSPLKPNSWFPKSYNVLASQKERENQIGNLEMMVKKCVKDCIDWW